MPAQNSVLDDRCSQRGRTLEKEFSEESAGSVKWMNPKDIKFTQKKISHYFTQRASHVGTAVNSHHGLLYGERARTVPTCTVHDTLLELQNGNLKVNEIPLIRVCKYEENWYSLDNRRLWVFKNYGRIIQVEVQLFRTISKEFFQKFDSRETMGENITFLDSKSKMDDKDTFLNTVLKWSIENVMNKKMYVNKVTPIGKIFPDFKAYFQAFKLPLLEDTRSQLQQSLEDIGSKPSIQISSMKDTTKDKNESRLRTLKVCAKVVDRSGFPKNWKNDLLRHERGEEEKKSQVLRSRVSVKWRGEKDVAWNPKRTDLVLLTTSVPKKLEDLKKSGELYSFAEIVFANESSSFLTVKVYMHTESPEYLAIGEEKRSWHLVFLDTLATRIRTWEALASIASAKSSPAVAEEILLSGSIKESTFDRNGHQTTMLEETVRKYCDSRRLNKSQSEAVTTSLMSLTRGTGRRVNLIQGPPGTGKTQTTTALVYIASCLKKRVLVCAPTNRAISEVAERCVQLLLENNLSATQFSDFMPPHEKQLCRQLQLGDVVLLGNEEMINTDGPLGKIFISSRVQRLTEATCCHSGWTPNSIALADFLRNGLMKFWKKGQEESKELVQGKRQEQLSGGGQEQHGKGAPEQFWEFNQTKFLGFVRDSLNRIGKKMIEYSEILCNDLPTDLLSEVDRNRIKDLRPLVKMLLEAIAVDSLLEADIMQIFAGFACQRASRGRGSSGVHDFYSARKHLLEKLSGAALPKIPPLGFNDRCLRSACLVFCTTSSAGKESVKQSGSFNFAVVDEAGQVIEAETAIVTQLPKLERLLLVGDPKQLPAVVNSEISKRCGYGKSLFERLQNADYRCHLLTDQYRMHPAISDFPNRHFYQGAITDGSNVKSQTYRAPYQNSYGAYAFIDVKDGKEERYEVSRGWMNPTEAEVVHHLVMEVRSVPTEKWQDADIGVITPYRGQADLIQQRQLGVVSRGGRSDQLKGSEVAVKTVDGFQGGEKDAIIISAVRANDNGNIGFLDDPRRLNVALTRGRYCVWIVGNAATLENHELWRALIEDARQRQCFWTARGEKRKRTNPVRITRGILSPQNVNILPTGAQNVKGLSTSTQNVKASLTSGKNVSVDSPSMIGDARNSREAPLPVYRPTYDVKALPTSAHDQNVMQMKTQNVSVDSRTMTSGARSSHDIIVDIPSPAANVSGIAQNVGVGKHFPVGDVRIVHQEIQDEDKHTPTRSDKQLNPDSCTKQRLSWLDLCGILAIGGGITWVVSKVFGGK